MSCTSNFVVSSSNLYSILLPKSCLRQSSSYCPRNTSHFYIHTLQFYNHTQNPFTITFYSNYITNKLLAKNSVTMHNDMKCMKYMNIYLVNLDYCTSPLWTEGGREKRVRFMCILRSKIYVYFQFKSPFLKGKISVFWKKGI